MYKIGIIETLLQTPNLSFKSLHNLHKSLKKKFLRKDIHKIILIIMYTMMFLGARTMFLYVFTISL